MTDASPRRAGLFAGTTLFLVYVATLAPGITLWDAGEFASAVESLGIPHPPGTPLFVLVARTWRMAWPFLSTAVATNLLAAVCTAASGAIAAALLARWTRNTAMAVAGALAFGTMSTVWFNATETEVYSASLLLSMLMLWSGAMAGAATANQGADATSAQYVRLLVYLFALTPPLHLSAMVAAPGAIALAMVDAELRTDISRAWLLLGAAVLAVGVGSGAWILAAAGGVILGARAASAREARVRATREAAEVIGLVMIAASAFAFLLLRARLDPALNQGNPSSLDGVIDVIARRQYDVPGLWPRRAPLWLQIGNLFQYVDWQFALGLDRAVGASWLRTPFTPIFLALGVAGSLAHRRLDRRTWAATLILVASATFGVVLYLNLRAGPSYGYGILPADADREARERDYFFALGFASVALWIGIGAVDLARRIARGSTARAAGWAGIVVAALPIALNWRAADRRRQPGASLPTAFARATLATLPPRAVLFVAGDNDTYPLWYAQTAGHVRRDVTIVTVPLLPAPWYRGELARRHGLYDASKLAGWRGTRAELASIATLAERAGRPIAAAVALEPPNRAAIGNRWSFRGLSFVRPQADVNATSPSIDSAAVDSAAALVASLFPGALLPERVDDPASRYLTSLLACPSLAAQAVSGTAADSARLLDSRCNFR
ncbi:MAG TPA: DUF2723 domain-containing protein [Gemmatimonadaceae bacterium]|nr:DUF2723 domain-containing protein [Gemmatimonadaceae bacterium]